MSPNMYRSGTESSDDSMSSRHSDSSDHSRSTAPTQYSTRPVFQHYDTAGPKLGGCDHDSAFDNSSDYRASAETYSSTIPSIKELPEDYPEYEIPESDNEVFASNAIPSIPPEFAELFPSSRRLLIRHDDATADGNMNLRVDTEVSTSRGKVEVILFHLRMHDLQSRKFSFRRYCRESGREVCHTSREYQKPAAERRPALQRSMSHALASLMPKSETKTTTSASLTRQDSGYGSEFSDDDEEQPKSTKATAITPPTNTLKLEFSNYAQVDLKRRGAKSSKHYDFEYWGTHYNWKRASRKHGDSKEVSYHLVNSNTGSVVAHIVPEPLTPAQMEEEEARGGWIPPCSLWISDDRICSGLTDVADVVVATGLVALVDDCIKRRFQRKRGVQLVLPVPMKTPFKMNMEYVGPKQLIDQVFNRRPATSDGRAPSRSPASSRPGTSHQSPASSRRPAAVRRITAAA